MPAIQPSSKVLVSGANGFIAIWVVKAFLEKGYEVRATVRSEEKGVHLKKVFASYGDKLELFIVDNIATDGAFDEAVKGIDAIEHTASPFHFNADDPQELIGPAVKGTLGILQSALKNSHSVKRITVLSSCASVMRNLPESHVFTEADWNDQSIEQVKELGRKANNAIKYRASKTLAEKAAWEFYKEHKSEVKWDLVVLNPPYVFGPVLHEISTPSALNTSNIDWYQTVVLPNAGGKSPEVLATQGSSWIDVRDLADAHVLAAEREEAAGERLIVSAGAFVWQDWLDAANAIDPSPIPSHVLPRGNPGAGANATHMLLYDTSKAAKVLGLSKYRSLQDTAGDMLADFEKRGW